MPKYLVRVPELYHRTVAVAADSEEDALRRYVRGEGTPSDRLIFVRTLDFSSWQIEEAPPSTVMRLVDDIASLVTHLIEAAALSGADLDAANDIATSIFQEIEEVSKLSEGGANE